MKRVVWAVATVAALGLIGVGLRACGGLAAGPDRTILDADGALAERLREFEGLDAAHRALVAGEDEPGERLEVLVVLVSADSGEPIAGAEVVVFQADRNGSYEPEVAGDESSARLRASVRTDAAGRYLISTVVPGDYGSTEDNRHIHTMVEGGKPAGYDLFFGQYMNGGLARWARGNSQAFVLDLRRLSDGRLIAETRVAFRGYGDGVVE